MKWRELYRNESDGNCAKNRRSWKGGCSKRNTQNTGNPRGDSAGNLYGPGRRGYSEEVFSAWRNIYICAELCRESGAGIGNAFLHYGYGKGDCCFRSREKGCSRTGGIRGVCLSSGRTESGIHKPQRGIRYQFSERWWTMEKFLSVRCWQEAM